MRDRRGLYRMVVGFTTIYAIGAYHRLPSEFESCSNEVYSIQNYVIKVVSNLREVCGFHRYSGFSTNKTDRHDITEILLKVVFNTIILTLNPV